LLVALGTIFSKEIKLKITFEQDTETLPNMKELKARLQTIEKSDIGNNVKECIKAILYSTI
jgi:hypothetical protein